MDGFAALPRDALSFLLFPVETPENFDAVVVDEAGQVQRIEVKQRNATSHWVWGAFAMPARVFHELHALWQARQRADEYMGTLVNAYLAQGGRALGIKAGETYVDVGTLGGYRQALRLLASADADTAPPQSGAMPISPFPTVERIP
jgi:dTDP-glucose pyrophosphorylase